MKKSVLIYSGGLDSTCLLYYLLQIKQSQVHCLNIQYGSKHNKAELAAALEICKMESIPCCVLNLDLDMIFESALLSSGGPIPEGHYEDETMKKTVVPFRNGIMLSIAAGYAESIGATMLFYGAHAGDHAIYPDCRPQFENAMAKAISLGTYNQVTLLAPFINYSKGQVVEVVKGINVPYFKTWTCYNGREVHCGRCGACTERKEAFQYAGIKDETIYEE